MKIVVSFILTVSGLLAFNCSALDEGSLPQTFQQIAIPYFDSAAAHMIQAKDGTKIYWRFFPASLPTFGTIVIVNGWTEYMRKYAELAYDLRNSGYALVMYDHRGQGESERLIPDSLKSYVKNYRAYVTDLNQLMNQIVKPLAAGKDIFLLGHSMGGAIATAYLESYPTTVRALAASSPMYGIVIDPAVFGYKPPVDLPDVAGLAAAQTAVGLGFGTSYAPGESDTEWNKPFESNNVTTSRNRYNDALSIETADPQLVVSGATWKWLAEGIQLSFYTCDNAALLKVPSIILEAGDERLVLPERNEIFASEAKSVIVKFPTARHEIFMEQDPIRNRAIKDVLAFFSKHASGTPVALSQ